MTAPWGSHKRQVNDLQRENVERSSVFRCQRNPSERKYAKVQYTKHGEERCPRSSRKTWTRYSRSTSRASRNSSASATGTSSGYCGGIQGTPPAPAQKAHLIFSKGSFRSPFSRPGVFPQLPRDLGEEEGHEGVERPVGGKVGGALLPSGEVGGDLDPPPLPRRVLGDDLGAPAAYFTPS